MNGAGQAWGAVTILNATATGLGCSLAVDASVQATWAWKGSDLVWQGSTDDRLARAVLSQARQALGREDGAMVSTQSTMPPARGLKTSNSAGTAMLRAAVASAGTEMAADRIDELVVDAAIDAGVTLTGAYDDQVATAHGGCALTDNASRTIKRRIPVPEWDVAIWVPEHSILKDALRHVRPVAARSGAEAAVKHLLEGDVPRAMTTNGRAFTQVYIDAGLPIDPAPADVAMQHGALGAGLSGTGPAVAALFEQRTDLPAVAGGTWRWQRSVGGPT